MTTAVGRPPPGRRSDRRRIAAVSAREQAARESRQWVRLTRCCNNRCLFCLDSKSQDGSHLPLHLIRGEIIEGRRRGATRLILSGGEPTIHPSYADFIRLGRELGYDHIQTITNGRMFAYADFLHKCIDAGLREITFSVHGPDAGIHDRLVGVPGAFEQAMKGLLAALEDGRIVVNVDVCLNRINIASLPELLRRFISLGVKEFDLLQLIPFGRAFDLPPEDLFYDVERERAAIEHALRLSESPDLTIWFNRFPPAHLEGYEHLIQDPHKLLDEVRGRQKQYEALLRDGTPLACRQPERCRLCYLQAFCDELDRTRHRLAGPGFDYLRVRAHRGDGARPRIEKGFSGVWVQAPDLAAATAALRGLPGEKLVLQLESYRGLAETLERGRVLGKTLVQAHTRDPETLDRLLCIPGRFEVVACLTAKMAEHLLASPADTAGRLAVRAVNHDRLTAALERDADLPAFFRSFGDQAMVENVPPCICGREPRPSPRLLDENALGCDGRLDITGFVHDYIELGYYTRSVRCLSCSFSERCPGVHINFARAHGYATLQPVGRRP